LLASGLKRPRSNGGERGTGWFVKSPHGKKGGFCWGGVDLGRALPKWGGWGGLDLTYRSERPVVGGGDSGMGVCLWRSKKREERGGGWTTGG